MNNSPLLCKEKALELSDRGTSDGTPKLNGEATGCQESLLEDSRGNAHKSGPACAFQDHPLPTNPDPLSEDGRLTYDGVLKMLGECGRYQKWVCLVLGLPSASGAMQVLITVFTLAVPLHRCALPGVPNDTWRVQSDHHSLLVNTSIPPSQSSTFDSCSIYISTNHQYDDNGHQAATGSMNSNYSSNGLVVNGQQNVSRHTETCHRYVYDTSDHTATVATELDLVCGRSLYRSHAQMMVMLGSLLGSQLIGLLADVWGRKIAIMAAIMVHVTSAFALTWVTSYVMLLAFLFLLGMSVSGMIFPTFVLSMELVGPSKRMIPGYGIMSFWSLGMILLAPLAYALRDWQHLQLTTSLLAVPLLFTWWLIPESPRWLLSKGRVAEAEVIVERIARVNRVTLPAGILQNTSVQDKAGLPVWKACFHFKLFFRNLIIFFAWFVTSLTYYGLSWNVGTLGGSVYVNMALSGLVELVAFAFCLGLVERLGRRTLCCGLLMLAGIMCTSTLLPVLFASSSLQWITVVLAMAGKLGISGAFGTLYIFTSELFPTVLRNSGMGASSVSARVGGIMAPYIANLGQSIGGDAATAVPLVIFGASSIVAGFLLFLLPETLRRRLPETIQDAINMSRKREKV